MEMEAKMMTMAMILCRKKYEAYNIILRSVYIYILMLKNLSYNNFASRGKYYNAQYSYKGGAQGV